ncbi:structural maintenance of chromosomes (SMC)family protein [Striga asiatica]|uniref:Structural maintenance of chromosomes (SMC)family protein n=1 Tax=Striga asiatica TaxID=4170 RepID=A0A5A7PM19_STRAF|nr:structural maintenance of chromosomes (SMC)family protein [Striga asiatica]
MDRMTSLENIARGFQLEGWTELEEKVCYRLFFQLCAETDDIDKAPVLSSLWFEISRQLSDLMQKKFTWMKVREKIYCLQGHYREFLRFLTIPGVRVHEDGGLVSVNREECRRRGNYNLLPFYFCNFFSSVDKHVGSPIHDLPLPMDPLFNVDGNEDLMDEESDVDSCVDSV